MLLLLDVYGMSQVSAVLNLMWLMFIWVEVFAELEPPYKLYALGM